eukprot:TRINITY_DN4151_c0_g2_i1.p1 TRINITY_DN4151_c0_g2~~TRINITY_DN4151_c0_g2_i1.p1  ORF type:complete len:303 (+),score=92.24 TRINITY_DN4151_c0_g2_i1:54-911(+)
MGGGISTIVDLAVLTHSITVQVNLYDGYGGWYTPIHCAAFPAPSPEETFDWDSVTTVTKVPTSTGAGDYVMPDITFDKDGTPIQPETEYVIKCGIEPTVDGPKYFSTTLKTVALSTCTTGVKLNGNDIAQIDMQGQESLMLGGTRWFGFPKSMEGMHAYSLPRPVPASSVIEMTCCPGEECAFFFALYNCEACTGLKPAGLAQTLILDGWDTGACSPKFDDNFKTTAFHKSVDAVHAKVVMAYTVPHDEITVMFGIEGSIQQPWCARPHGPVAAGGGCGAHCPKL